MAQMTAVVISSAGVVKNILSLNYTHETTMREYLNNVLDKNTHPDYSIQFNMKNINRHVFMFECVETHACGFLSLDEMQRAFSIADSERSGTNNMGYGIFSPITINRGHDAHGLFLQSNEHGSYYSIVYFNDADSKIWTHCGEIVDGCILGKDVSHMMVEGGTRFVWITHPNIDEEGEDTNYGVEFVVKLVSGWWRKSLSKPVISDISEDVSRLGSYYNEYLTHPVNPRNIRYGDEPVRAINFLQKDDGTQVEPSVYEIAIAHIEGGGLEFQVKNSEGDWKLLTVSASNPVGDTDARRSSYRINEKQTGVLKVYDIDTPDPDIHENMREATNMRRSYRKIWVKINDTYIFSEDFSMNGWPNSRAVLELDNTGDNNFNEFISPDPNKSNSSINPKLKERLVPLIKKTLNTDFSTNPRVMITPTLKHQVWEAVAGNVCRSTCTSPDCSKEMTAWKYDVMRLNPARDNVLENLTPICKECSRTLD